MNITTDYNVDVLVCGGGVAGCAAAIAAARQGMRTLLIEKRESFGGLCTNGYITGIAGHVDGICQEWVERLAKENAAVVRPHLPAVEPEMGKVMLERMLIQSGARFLYGVHVAEVEQEMGHITTIIAYTVNGQMRIRAKMVIDATGDAIVASAAGVPCDVGDIEFMGMNESTSMGFRLSYVNYRQYLEAFTAYNKENRAKPAEQRVSYFVMLQRKAISEGDLPYLLSPGNLVYPIVGSSNHEDMDVCLDATATYYCRNTSVEDTTRQIVDQHRKVLMFVKFLRKYVPGFERCTLSHFAEQNGTRESRRIVGRYVFTADDICRAKKFEDGIAIYPEPLDSHHPTDSNQTALRHIHLPNPTEPALCRPSTDDDNFCLHPYAPLEGFEVRPNPREFSEIPLGALIAQDVDNLFAVGRSMSADWHGLGGARVIATSMTTGQAAGNAAAWAIKNRTTAPDVDGRAVREMQKKQNVPLDKPLEGYWAKIRDMEGDLAVTLDMAVVIGKDGRSSFQS